MGKTPNNKLEVMQGFRLGKESAFDEIFHELSPLLYYYSFQITGEKGPSEEISEEAFVKVWKRREMFIHFNVLKSYLQKIVRNDSLDWIEAEKRRKSAEQGSVMAIPFSENPTWDNKVQTELIKELHAAIAQLPPQRKRVFKMLYQDGMSVKEVAKELNLTTAAIKHHKKFGLIFLRKIITALIIATQLTN